jgi:hypothetical protein
MNRLRTIRKARMGAYRRATGSSSPAMEALPVVSAQPVTHGVQRVPATVAARRVHDPHEVTHLSPGEGERSGDPPARKAPLESLEVLGVNSSSTVYVRPSVT